MASDLSTYLGNKIIRWLAGQAMPSAPTNLYVGLFDGDPKGAGTEVTTDVRAAGRVEVTFTEPASGVTNTMPSDIDVDFGNADGPTDVSHFAIFDAVSSGNPMASDALPGGPYSITAAQPVLFPAGDITFTVGS